MGVASSKFQRKSKLQMIDFGSITPLGLYEKNNDDYDLQVVRELILSKKLSPFYKGLSDPLTHDCDANTEKPTTVIPPRKRPSLYRKPKSRGQDYKLYLSKNEKRLYAILYNDSIECPICFLYYPANINFTRCCDQPICTECFVQIKKRPADASTSTSVARDCGIVCPYCMTDNFGVIYHCPPSTPTIHLEKVYKMRSTTSGLSQHQQSKRKSIESDHPNVVLIDHVRMKPSDAPTSKSDMRASWFQSSSRRSSNVTSLDRYLSTIRLEDMSIQDIVALESMRQSLLEKDIHNRNHNNHRLYQSYIF